MEIFLLRHAIAVEHELYSGPDEDRPLTPEGRRKLRRVASGMRALKLSFDIIFSSPLARALETAEIAAGLLRLKKRMHVTDFLTPSTSPAQQIAWLKNLRPPPASVLLVGHEPNFSELTSHLLTGGPALNVNFKKAGLCKVTAERLGSRATLEWFLTPKQLERMR